MQNEASFILLNYYIITLLCCNIFLSLFNYTNKNFNVIWLQIIAKLFSLNNEPFLFTETKEISISALAV